MNFSTTSIKYLGGIFLAVAILLSTHLGEFWPFSIYPMFSKAGKVWERSLVRDVTNTPEHIIWQTFQNRDQLPGISFAMDEISINQNDVSNYLQKAGIWDERKIRGMRHLFRSELQEDNLLLYKVNGHFTENRDSVIITYTPFMLMKSDTTIFNPNLDIKQ